MRYNAVFVYQDIIKMGATSPITSSVATTIDNIDSDDPKYTDWTTLNIKIGDEVFYNKKDTDSVTGFRKTSFTRTSLGRISVATIAGRATFPSGLGEEPYQDFINGGVEIYVVRDLNKSGRYVYSYPLDNYIGACGYTESIVSLFFKRTDNLIEEIRIDIQKGSQYSSILAINKSFNGQKKEDIIFDNTDNNIKSTIVYGVNKVISTISPNRN